MMEGKGLKFLCSHHTRQLHELWPASKAAISTEVQDEDRQASSETLVGTLAPSASQALGGV